MKTIGVTQSSYPTVRNISNVPFTNYQVKKTYDLFKFPAYLAFKLFKKDVQFFLNSHQDFGMNSCDILHFFNAISFGKTPWISTFETFLPRYGDVSQKLEDFAVKKMAGSHCKKLIAISECSKKIQKDYLQKNYPKYFDSISKKIVVVHPGQSVLFDSINEKSYSDNITFTFVGSLFFLKGGLEVLKVFDGFLSQGANIKLNIVSDLAYGDGITCSTRDDYQRALALIEKNKDFIVHYKKLPNDKVLNLLKESHVALLPTYADTYGYSVLEAKAAGCAVVTTDIRAMPEINNNKLGYVIEVPKNDLGYAIVGTNEERQTVSNKIEQGMYKILADILSNPGEAMAKGALALESIKTHHDPKSKAEILESIYDESLYS